MGQLLLENHLIQNWLSYLRVLLSHWQLNQLPRSLPQLSPYYSCKSQLGNHHAVTVSVSSDGLIYGELVISLSSLRKGRMIQQRISRPFTHNKESLHVCCQFSNCMSEGKTKAALRLLSEQHKGKILHLDDPVDTGNDIERVCDILVDKHPPSIYAHPDSIINVDLPDVHPILFESLDVPVIKFAAFHISGAAGPSGLDTISWRRLFTSLRLHLKSCVNPWLRQDTDSALTWLIQPVLPLSWPVNSLLWTKILESVPSGLEILLNVSLLKPFCLPASMIYGKHQAHCNCVLAKLLALKLVCMSLTLCFKEMISKQCCYWLLPMHSALSIDTQLSLISKDYVPHLPLLLSAFTGPLQIVTWIVISFFLREGPELCLCMFWLHTTDLEPTD